MVRKAETLYSLNELNLSKSTHSYLERNLDLSLDQLVLKGRQAALDFEEYPQHRTKFKWRRELVDALDAAGFIRHDLYSRTYRVWCLYAGIGYSCRLYNLLGANGDYEKVPVVTDEEYSDVIKVLDTLREREKAILMARYGLEHDHRMSCDEIGQEIYDLSGSRIGQIFGVAWRKMWLSGRKSLPPLFIREMPGIVFDGDKASLDTRVENMGLSACTTNCLISAGIGTLRQILDYDRKGFAEIRKFGARSGCELTDKMLELGYSRFTIDCTSLAGNLKPDDSIRCLGLNALDRNRLHKAGLYTIKDVY